MNKVLEAIYYRSPVFLQNIAVSGLGYKLYRERYNKSWKEMYSLLMETEKYDKEMIDAYQNSEFVELARHAIRTTEYYSAWAKKEGINPKDITSIRDIELFPVIEKPFIRNNTSQFYASNWKEGSGKIWLNTSGTTGTSLHILTNKVDRARHYAFFTRLREWYGVGPSAKRATLLGRVIMPTERDVGPFWRYDKLQRNLLMSSYHLSEKNLSSYYQKLIEYSPEEIFAYPSSLTSLAQHIVKHDLPPVRAKLIMTTAETLLESQRKLLEKAFLAPVVNQYGSVEMSFFAAQNTAGVMQFHPEHGITEIRDQGGRIRNSGSGEIIATGLINRSMPIIRYALGDTVTIQRDDDSPFLTIESLEGRTDDVIYTPSGRVIGRLGPVFKMSKNIRQAQIVQKKDNSIELKYVPTEEYEGKDGDDIVKELQRRIGRELPIYLTKCDEIAKGKNGKIKLVVSELEK